MYVDTVSLFLVSGSDLTFQLNGFCCSSSLFGWGWGRIFPWWESEYPGGFVLYSKEETYRGRGWEPSTL